MSARKRSRVTRDGKTLTVYPYGEKWRFGWRENESAPWRYVTKGSKGAAEKAAFEKIGELARGGVVLSALTGETRRFVEAVLRMSKPSDFAAVLAFLESRGRSAEIVASVARFMDWKVAQKDGETRHLGNVRRDLEAMAKAFVGRSLVDISDAELKAWWESRTNGRSGKTRNEARGNLVAFYNWAVRDGIHPKEVTAAEKLPRVELGICERRVLTRVELLAVAGAVAEEWRPWVVLGAFCGLRPEEIAPVMGKLKTRKNKRGIRAEEIDFRWKVIRVPAEVSKIGAPRNVPLSEAALAWLEWAGIRPGMSGAICPRNPTEEGETLRLGKKVFLTGWPQDALRHSYGSYRNALIRNLPQVAEEMGTSETMLRRHYHNPRTLEEGEEWFGLRPEMIRFDPILSGVGDEMKKPRRTGGA